MSKYDLIESYKCLILKQNKKQKQKPIPVLCAMFIVDFMSPTNFQFVRHKGRGITKRHILQVCGNYRVIRYR